MKKIKILILVSDPSNASRLHLGKELQAIHDKMEGNPNFEIRNHLATKPNDILEEIMNYKPQIVHFSGHGLENGELCFEDDQGRSKIMPPEALSSLFSLAIDYVKCVVVNTCYSEKQAKAIALHIPAVIGTKKEITDEAAFKFSSGFYTSIDPELSTESIDKAFKLGCIAIQFDDTFQEHLTPVIIKGSAEIRFASEVDSSFKSITNPKGYAVEALISGLGLTGRKMGLSREQAQKIIDDRIWKLEQHKSSILEYEQYLKNILRDEFPLSESSKSALAYLKNGLNLNDDDIKPIEDKILKNPKVNSATSWYDRGNGQFSFKNYELAIEYYTKAIGKKKDYSGAFARRGQCHYYRKSNDLAISDFSNAIKFNKNWEIGYSLSSTYFDRALAYFDMTPQNEENMKCALEDWTKFLEDNKDGAAYLNRGLTYKYFDKFEDAISDFKKSLELDYHDKTTLYSGILSCYTQLAKTKEIKEWSEIASKHLKLTKSDEGVDVGNDQPNDFKK